MKTYKKILLVLGVILLTIFVYAMGINYYVKYTVIDRIKDTDEIKNIDTLIVLGAKVHDDGRLSLMLKDRLDKTIEVYNKLDIKRVIVSGDSEHKDYDETTKMKEYLINNGIPEEDIIVDIYGLSTYDSIYRLKNVYGINKSIIITQKYHLYRSIYIANSLGIEAYGIPASGEDYFGQTAREIREILARNKDFLTSLFNVKSKYIEKAN